MTDYGDDNSLEDSSQAGYNTAETYQESYANYQEDDETYGDDDAAWEDDQREREIEEEVVIWYASQNIDAQTCAQEDLELVVDAVEVEISAYYNRMQAEHRGVTSPANSSNYAGGSSTMSSQERQAKVLAAKQRSHCRACGQLGHWQRDPICPQRGRGKGFGKKGKGGKFGKSKGDHGKSRGKGGKKDKPRVVYFAVGEASGSGDGHCYMVLHSSLDDPGTPTSSAEGRLDGRLDAEQQRALEAEVQRLMQLPRDEIDRRLQQELDFMPPVSQAAPSLKSPTPVPKAIMPPPESTLTSTSRTPLTASSLTSMRPSVPPMPTRSSGPILEDEPGDPTPEYRGVCSHRNTTKRGSNAYITMVTCKDCGMRLHEERREPDTDRPMAVFTPMECPHPTDQVSWRGSNGYAWKWTCAACGASDSVKKQPGQPRPVPGQGSTSVVVAAEENINNEAQALMDETLFVSSAEWEQFRGLLGRMVNNHITLHGAITQGEFLHVVNATLLCYKTAMTSMPVAKASPGARSTTSAARSTSSVGTLRTESGGIDGSNMITFGRYKGYTFADVYEMDPGYVQFALDERAKGSAYCTNMQRFQEYCTRRRESEGIAVAYMVDDEFAVSGPEDDDVLMYLDSGCNSTCHGQYWMERFEDATNYRPQWMSRERKNLMGIGGAALSLGIRKLYIALETLEGYNVPGIITSIEIEGSHAPLLLSLQAQQDLGMVIDLVEGTVKSRTLGCTFNAVRGRRNRLIGLRLTPGDFMNDGATIPVSLMAEADDGDRGDREQWRRHVKTFVTHEVKKVPVKKKRHKGQQRCAHRRNQQESARGSADPPSFETYNGLEDWTEDDVFPPAPQPLPETEDDEFVYVEVDVTDDEDDDVIITEENPENAESEEEENPERRDESTQDIINELEALPDEIFDAIPDELFMPGGGDEGGSPSSPSSRHPEEDEADYCMGAEG